MGYWHQWLLTEGESVFSMDGLPDRLPNFKLSSLNTCKKITKRAQVPVSVCVCLYACVYLCPEWFLVNMTQARIIWEEELQLRKFLYQIGL